jgi:hypothetical protein
LDIAKGVPIKFSGKQQQTTTRNKMINIFSGETDEKKRKRKCPKIRRPDAMREQGVPRNKTGGKFP